MFRRVRPDAFFVFTASLIGLSFIATGFAEAETPTAVMINNVRIFDGRSDQLSEPSYVLIRGNQIESISGSPIDIGASDEAPDSVQVIDGSGRTLMPGLIDAHTHLMLLGGTQLDMLDSDVGYLHVLGVLAAEKMLMRGFTSVRDVGGPVLGLKQAIDRGLVAGPRIYPSGAFVSQTGGHGDYRMRSEMPASPNELSLTEKIGVAAIADSPDMVRRRVREQLALGASQIKLMAGGGVASRYDHLDVTQYTVEELRAAVEAAENWGTYVTVHVYTSKAVRQAIEAGVKCIEHGQLIDEPTAQLLADKGIWWSLQPFLDDEDRNPYPEGSASRQKQLQVARGTERAYQLARKFKIKTAWGTDMLYSPEGAKHQGRRLTKLAKWYSNAEVLQMATSVNAELLALAGPRNPYPGKLGVVEPGALADLLLVDGDPLADIHLIEDPENRFLVIMKDGKVMKNLLGFTPKAPTRAYSPTSARWR